MLKEQIYEAFVNKTPIIKQKYKEMRNNNTSRINAWAYLLYLNFAHCFRGFKSGKYGETNFYARKKLLEKSSESQMSKRVAPCDIANMFAIYEVISFDVFDTLIFRPFSKPTDLFFMIGEKLNYLNFEQIRIAMEVKARKRKKQQQGTTEVSLEEIWTVMEEETGIPKLVGMNAELDCEMQYCFPNPYMQQVFIELKKLNKKIIVISDMYLKGEYIQQLLDKCGYGKFEYYYSSCDYGQSKSEGSLYQKVMKEFGEKTKYIHIGDNRHSDQKQAAKAGWAIWPYDNVNDMAMRYRAEDMSIITGSMYRGIVNTYLHNGLNSYSRAYEYGFIYGGLFVLGYCQWIHEYVQQNGIDKILFLSRDGDILSQVYENLYPNERIEYVYWSRIAATKMTAKFFKYDYFRRFLYHKVNQGYQVKDIFNSMELDDMLEDCIKSVKLKVAITNESILDIVLVDEIKKYLMNHWESVLEHYLPQLETGKAYYSPILADCKKVVAVDVGWAGSGAMSLDYLVNNVWGLKCSVTGLIAGTNSIYSEEPDASEVFLYNGKLVSYLFSQNNNRDIWKKHNPDKGHNVIIELLLASLQQSFRGFGKSKGKFAFTEGKAEIDSEQVQNGIRDFADIYIKHIGKTSKISGRDAFAPIEILMQNEVWINQVIKKENFKMNVE